MAGLTWYSLASEDASLEFDGTPSILPRYEQSLIQIPESRLPANPSLVILRAVSDP